MSTPQQTYAKQNIRFTSVIEFALLLGALAILYVLSLPFGRLVDAVPKGDAITLALYQQGFAWYAKLALAGMVAFWLGRRRLPAISLPFVVLAVWCVFWAIQPVGRPLIWGLGTKVFSAGAVTFLVCAVATMVLSYGLRDNPFGRWLPRRGPGSVIAYPGFVLFTGIGWLWLMDYFVNGHFSQFVREKDELVLNAYPLKHASDLGLAFVMLTLVASIAPALMRVMVYVGSWLESISFPVTKNEWKTIVISKQGWILLGWIALLVICFLAPVGVYYLYAKTAQLKQEWAPRTTEWIRLPLLLGLGYLCYRWLDTQRHGKGFAVVGALLVGSAMLAFFATGEKGQFLLCGVVVLLVGVAALFQYRSQNSLGGAGGFDWVASLMVTAALLIVLSALLHYLPNLIGTHVMDRAMAKENPFQAREDFLAVFEWFGSASGLFGFGMGQVQWCGYAVTLGQACGKQTGVPFQISSDYAFFGLAGVWGMVGAAMITVALLLWLFALMVSLMPKRQLLLSFSLLRGWLVGAWAVAMMVQVFLTVCGALGLYVLTGVPLPMIAMGLTSMLSIAFFVGLAASQVEE
jgi:cell division protein FtsW (lipid II flippase)